MALRLAGAAIIALSLCASASAQTPGIAGAKAFWEQQKQLAEAFDSKFADGYAADAEIVGIRSYGVSRPTREMRMTGEAWANLTRLGMPLARLQKDVSTYRDEKFAAADGKCVKLIATRYSERKKHEAPHEVVMCPRSGVWRITREVTITRP